MCKSSATQPVRQVSSIPEVSRGKGGDPDQQPRYRIILRVSNPRQLKNQSLDIQLYDIETSIDSGAPREVHRVCASVFKGVPPSIEAIFKAARSGDTILVYRVDRLGRNSSLFLPWLEIRSERQRNFSGVRRAAEAKTQGGG